MAGKEEVVAWQNRIFDEFAYKGVIGGHLLTQIMEQEKLVGLHYVSAYVGHRYLTDAFADFFAMTLQDVIVGIQKHSWPKEPHYADLVTAFFSLFRTVRAAEIVAVNGYPLDGYAMLRNIKEQALCLGAIGMGLSSFPTWYGYKGIDPSDWNREKDDLAKKNRKTEEHRIRSVMLGRLSGLEQEHIDRLKHWEGLFDMQIHGSRLTTYDAMAQLKDGRLSIGPVPVEMSVAIYMNRVTEITWMIHRTFWYLQRADVRFNADWQRRWNLLEESFRMMVTSLEDQGKLIVKSIEALVDAKFQFGPGTVYEDRN